MGRKRGKNVTWEGICKGEFYFVDDVTGFVVKGSDATHDWKGNKVSRNIPGKPDALNPQLTPFDLGPEDVSVEDTRALPRRINRVINPYDHIFEDVLDHRFGFRINIVCNGPRINTPQLRHEVYVWSDATDNAYDPTVIDANDSNFYQRTSDNDIQFTLNLDLYGNNRYIYVGIPTLESRDITSISIDGAPFNMIGAFTEFQSANGNWKTWRSNNLLVSGFSGKPITIHL